MAREQITKVSYHINILYKHSLRALNIIPCLYKCIYVYPYIKNINSIYIYVLMHYKVVNSNMRMR